MTNYILFAWQLECEISQFTFAVDGKYIFFLVSREGVKSLGGCENLNLNEIRTPVEVVKH